jgi:hypothetical protein
MHQAHGFVEYRQLDEWFGVVDVGALLVPNTRLSALLLETASRHQGLFVPSDASIAFGRLYARVREHVVGVATFSCRQACALREHAAPGMQQTEVASLLNETLFDTLMDLCGVLARRFGEDDVRLLLYFD